MPAVVPPPSFPSEWDHIRKGITTPGEAGHDSGMARTEDASLIDMFRMAPGQSTLVTIVPLALGFVQLANSYFNELSLVVSVSFALAMVGCSSVLTQHSLAQYRRRSLERELLTLQQA